MTNINIGANVFGVVPETFFNLLTGRDKSFYVVLLINLKNEYSIRSIDDFDKEFVMRVIEQTLLDTMEELSDDDPDNSPIDSSSDQSRAYRRLKRCGWIEEDIGVDDRVMVRIPDAAMRIIRALNEIAVPARASLGGYCMAAFTALKSAKEGHRPFSVGLHMALENLRGFSGEFLRAEESIRKEINQIMKSETLKDAAENFCEYLTSTVEGDYFKLQFQESMSERHRKVLLQMTSDILMDDDLMARMYADAKEHLNLDSDEEAESIVRREIDELFRVLNDIIPDRYQNIMNIQLRYLRSAKLKFSMLSGYKKNIQSSVNNIVAAMESVDFDEDNPPQWFIDFQSAISMALPRFISEVSLYTPRNRTTGEGVTEELPPEPDNTQAIENSLRDISSTLTTEQVDMRIRLRMGPDKELRSADQPLQTMEDYDDLVIMACYSGCSDSQYDKEFTGNYIEKNGFVVPEYMIHRKKEV